MGSVVEEPIRPIDGETDIPAMPPSSIAAQVDWLESQQSSTTGLVESYDNTSDPALSNQASVYDQAVAVEAFIQGGRINSARKVMDFLVDKWDGRGFNNFYHTITGQSSLEIRVHTGPTVWVGIAAFALYEATGDQRYLTLAIDIAVWAAEVIPHSNGGVAMGPIDDSVPWTDIFSTEHNIDYAALLRQLLSRQADLTAEDRQLFESELPEVQGWIGDRFNLRTGVLDRGLNDPTLALDTTTFFVLTFGPEFIETYFGIDPDKLIYDAEEYFAVTVDIPGFDFTRADFREPVDWFEGTGQMVAVYDVMEKWHRAKGNVMDADYYKDQRIYYSGEIAEVRRVYPNGDEAIPYASLGSTWTFGDGWLTPADGFDGDLAVSTASVSWFVFGWGQHNPMGAGSVQLPSEPDEEQPDEGDQPDLPEPVVETIASFHNPGDAWMGGTSAAIWTNLYGDTDLSQYDSIRITFPEGMTGVNVMVRVLPNGGNANSQIGLSPTIYTIPDDGVVNVPIIDVPLWPAELEAAEQISIHFGEFGGAVSYDIGEIPGRPTFNTIEGVQSVSSPVTSNKSAQKVIERKEMEVSSPIIGKNNVGGIDLNPAMLNLQIKRDGNGVPLPVFDQPIENMHINGFLPVIINITPIYNLPFLLGLDMTGSDAEERTRDLSYNSIFIHEKEKLRMNMLFFQQS